MSEEEQIILPERFIKVDYIQSVNHSEGTCYIDTGVKPNQNIGFYVDFEMISESSSSIGQCIFGSRTSSTVKDFQFSRYSGGILRFGTNHGISTPFSLNNRYQASLRNGVFTHVTGANYNLPTTAWQGDYNIYLFSLNESNSCIQGGGSKIYRFKLYDGDTLIKDFVPAYDTYNWTFCMFDLVNQKAHYTNGTGNFTSDYVPQNPSDEQLGILHKLPEGFTKVNYLIANGGQYIDTNYIPTDETGYYIEAQSYSSSKDVHFFGCVNGTTFGTGVGRLYFCTGSSSAFYNCGWGSGQFALSSSFNSSHMRQELKYELNFLNRREAKLSINETDFIYKNIPNLNFVPSNSIYLFGTNMGGKTIHQPLLGHIGTFLISEGDQIVRQFVPCLNENGIPCMYELYTGTVHYNQGAGHFSYPKEYEFSYYELPAGYTKCVYLQSDGTQWINTQVVPDAETGFYYRALQMCYGNLIPFGIGENGFDIYPPRYSNKDLYYKWDKLGIKMMTWDKADDLIFSSYLNFYNSKIAKFNSVDTDAISVISSQAGVFTNPIWLFSYNRDGSYNETHGKWIGRIYRAQMTQGDTLIRDFVPCLDTDNRPCMYDLVTQEPYYNQSGGVEFSYCVEHQLPSDFSKLKYLESTGTQYIKTGYVPTNTTGLYIDALKVGNNDGIPMGIRNDNNTDTCIAVGNLMQSDCRFHWNKYVGVGGSGKYRFESTLNWLNDKKSIIKTPISNSKINTLSNLSFTPNQDFHIFGWNLAGTNNVNWDGRIYHAKISEGDQIVRDFVPAWDDSKQKPCMYDLINNVAYYNDGEGEFIYNRDFEGTYKGYTGLGCIGNRLGASEFEWEMPYGYIKCDFLESTGSQYMNPKLKVQNLNTKIKYYLIYGTVNGKYSGIFMMYNATSNDSYRHHTYKGGSGDWCGIATTRIRDVEKTIRTCSYSNQHFTSEINLMDGFMQVNDKRIEIEKNQTFVYSDNEPYLFAENTVSGNNEEGFAQALVQARIYSFEANYNGVEAANLVPAIDDKGRACFYDTIREMTFYNKASGEDFIVGINSITQAISLKLPENGGSIRISIPQTDNNELYEEKIRANNPNWEITFYYH